MWHLLPLFLRRRPCLMYIDVIIVHTRLVVGAARFLHDSGSSDTVIISFYQMAILLRAYFMDAT